MSTTTKNLGLTKPELTDAADITAMNENWDKIDEKLHKAYSNENKPSKEDVGLGNVPNVATNNQTPTHTEGTTLEKLTSGEKLSIALGKIAKAITELISHIADTNNPHGVTASQVDALPTKGGTVTGTTVFSKVQDVSGDEYAAPAVVIGGTPNTYHLEFDNNEVQAKQNETTPGNLFLNSNGGTVSVGEGGIELGSGSSINPETALTGGVGVATKPFNNIFGRYFNLLGGANAQYGRLRVGTTGTTSTDGTGTLELGNATPSGTAHNASGKITMYGSGTGFTNILPNNAASGSNSVTLPNKTGTLALTSDIPTHTTETWTFTLEDGSTVTKAVYVG